MCLTVTGESPPTVAMRARQRVIFQSEPATETRADSLLALRDQLESELQIGDLVLTGSGDVVSKLIRWGTIGNYSHSLVVLDNGRLIESFDWSGTPVENDAGLRTITIEELVSRGELHRVRVLRPHAIDTDRLLALADDTLANPPTFPSSGALLLGIAGLGDHPQIRFPPIRWVMDRWVNMLGDGPLRTTCAEFVTRMYLDAGLTLHFVNPRLGRYMKRVAHHEVHGLSDREPTPGLPVPDRKLGWIRAVVARTTTPLGIAAAVRKRMNEDRHCDAADLIVPSDFCRCPQFRSVLSVEVPH